MSKHDADFIAALDTVLDGTADETQRRLLEASIREDPERMRIYGEQMELHLLLRISSSREFGAGEPEGLRLKDRKVSDHKSKSRWWNAVRSWSKIAAGLAFLLAGSIALWNTLKDRVMVTPVTSETAAVRVAPIRLIRQANAVGLELPQTLPGTVRMESGEIVVRLGSGVELTLVGGADMYVMDVMQVRLKAGQLLAEVPHWAIGFTVFAPGQTVWDMGTIFSVSTAGEGSDSFVFKGSVQVTDEMKDAVGVCSEGEGVRVRPGMLPEKFSVGSGQTQRLFASVRGGAALKMPQKAFDRARKISDLESARYMSRLPPAAGTLLNEAQMSGAWKPMSEKENKMRITSTAAATLAATMMGAGVGSAAPFVSDVQLAQRTDSRMVDIYYKLTGTNSYVTLEIETNSLVSPAWSGVKIPDSRVTRLSGDVSRLITADEVNEKHIVWNAGADLPGLQVPEARAKVTAWAVDRPPQVLVFDMGGIHTLGHVITPWVYPSLEALPHGGLTNDIYRTDLLVMRRIDPGGFVMGSQTDELGREYADYGRESLHLVALTKAFYIGVFEMTKGHWARIRGTLPAANMVGNPVEQETFDSIRGGTWPETNDVISASSFIGMLRSRSADAFPFDLPTEAQWEFACRAGTQTGLNNNKELTTYTALCPNRDPIAWDGWNSGNTHHRVGEKLPNAWGLYDMIGNMYELVRDRYAYDLGYASATDPKGPASGSNHVMKGGACNSWRDARSAFRNVYPPYGGGTCGFRLAICPAEGQPN